MPSKIPQQKNRDKNIVSDNQSFFSRLGAGIEKFHHILSYLSAAGMLIMMIPTVADVAGRIFFNAPIRGRIEFTGLVMAFVIYLGVPYAQAQRSHVRVTVIFDRMSPKVQRILEMGIYLLAIVILGFTIYATGSEAIRSIKVGEYLYGSIRFPIWPSRTLVALGLVLLSLQFIVDFFRALVKPVYSSDQGETKEA
ncbi:TRAP transporter small permease subunit [Thermodesulfobacteriota bacterium]